MRTSSRSPMTLRRLPASAGYGLLLILAFSGTAEQAEGSIIEDPLSRSPLETERWERRQSLAEKLGRQFSVRAVGSNGWTDLHYAAVLDLPDVANELLDNGMRVDVRLDESFSSLGVGLVRTLREHGREDAENWRSYGQAPLHMAAAGNSLSVAEILVEKGADPGATDFGGVTPLHEAAWHDALSVAEFLLDKDGDATARATNTYGETPLHYAAWRKPRPWRSSWSPGAPT